MIKHVFFAMNLKLFCIYSLNVVWLISLFGKSSLKFLVSLSPKIFYLWVKFGEGGRILRLLMLYGQFDQGEDVKMRQANQELSNAEQDKRCGETGSLVSRARKKKCKTSSSDMGSKFKIFGF
jgi:hypothetical protein